MAEWDTDLSIGAAAQGAEIARGMQELMTAFKAVRRWLSTATIVAALSCVSPAGAQNPRPEYPVFGVDYSFERVRTKRIVNDRHEKGTIELISFVYRPLKNSNGGVVVDLHGSSGGLSRSPHEPMGGRPPWLGMFLQRGFTYVVPLRRGRGESGGKFIEECSTFNGDCTLEDNRRIATEALEDAIASTEVVVHDFVSPKLRPKGGKILLVGSSRGGVLALVYASRHPSRVSGVIGVSPGWLSIGDEWPKEENEARLFMQRDMLADAGRRYKGPTLWINGARDQYYSAATSQAFFDAYKGAGGQGDYIYVGEHQAQSGHIPPLQTWRDAASTFVDRLYEPAR